MFSKKKPAAPRIHLSDLVVKNHQTGYIFADINNDLGDAADSIMLNDSLLKMAYGYARRAAVHALFAQGFVSQQVLDHVHMIFQSLQMQTGQTKEFQEASFQEALSFLQSYHWQINRFTLAAIKNLAVEYERKDPGHISDAELMRMAIEVSHQEQESNRPR